MSEGGAVLRSWRVIPAPTFSATALPPRRIFPPRPLAVPAGSPTTIVHAAAVPPPAADLRSVTAFPSRAPRLTAAEWIAAPTARVRVLSATVQRPKRPLLIHAAVMEPRDQRGLVIARRLRPDPLPDGDGREAHAAVIRDALQTKAPELLDFLAECREAFGDDQVKLRRVEFADGGAIGGAAR